MRTALVHYWLLGQRGGEKVLDALCRMFPDADIFTLFHDPDSVSPEVRRHRVTASWLNPLRPFYRSLLPLMPMALESFDLRRYDLVISSESGPAKGVITRSDAVHICYCHSPMRYLWELYPAYRNEWTRSAWKRAAMAPLTNYLRVWDVASAARVDAFAANSDNVRRRIWKTYRRDSEVIYPPVDIASFYHMAPEDYFLIAGELVAYKRVDTAVRSFARSGRKLRIVGDGPEYKRLRSGAPGNIEFLGRVGDEELRDLYARCRAFLLPGEEDFGIAPVEALASGKPVIALGRGGVLESVPPFGAVLYDAPTSAQLSQAIRRFEEIENAFSPAELRQWAGRFSPGEFARRMRELVTTYTDAGIYSSNSQRHDIHRL